MITKWLKTLKVNDEVKAHYDGKAGRGCKGIVVSLNPITVKFNNFIEKKEVIVKFDDKGVGFDDQSDVMNALLNENDGDLYVLGPNY